jgi:hypothetical protein
MPAAAAHRICCAAVSTSNRAAFDSDWDWDSDWDLGVDLPIRSQLSANGMLAAALSALKRKAM